jgi:hypothetical protein
MKHVAFFVKQAHIGVMKTVCEVCEGVGLVQISRVPTGEDNHYLTVGGLRKILEGLPPRTPVHYQRIEDVYFDKHGWKPDLLIPDPDMAEFKDEFVRAFCAFQYRDDEGKMQLLLTAHY